MPDPILKRANEVLVKYNINHVTCPPVDHEISL